MRRKANSGTRGFAALLVLMLSSAGAGARTGPEEAVAAAGMGIYRGTVTERKSGNAVAGAVLVFINEKTNDTFEAVTDAKGVYEARLPAGEYVVDIRVGKKTYRSTGTFREEDPGKRWVMDFTVGTKIAEKDFKIVTNPKDIRVLPAEPRPPLDPSRKKMELFIFLGGVLGVAALSE